MSAASADVSLSVHKVASVKIQKLGPFSGQTRVTRFVFCDARGDTLFDIDAYRWTGDHPEIVNKDIEL